MSNLYPVMGVAVEQVGVSVEHSGGAAAPAQQSAEAARQRLRARHIPAGLANELVLSSVSFPLRIVLLDNSGSMQSTDGSRLAQVPGGFRKIRCTRWEELVETAITLGNLATDLGARTDFHLLNAPAGAPQFVTLADTGEAPVARCVAPTGNALDTVSAELLDETAFARVMRNVSPSGSTPLTEALVRIISIISPAADKLRARGQQIVVNLATDGLPNDKRSFEQALLHSRA